MSISQEALFKIALNLQDPWYISQIEFSAEGKQLDIHVDFKSGSKFSCPKCGKPNCSVHDTIERTWRHLNFFQFKTYIHCRVPRTECEDCGVKQINVPWARKSSGFTLLMDALIVLMSQNMTVSSIAEMIDEHDTRIWRVIGFYVEQARSQENLSEVKSVGVDETSRAKGHKYVTVFIDLDKSKVIYACEGKNAATIESFKDDFEQHHGSCKNITNFCCDMSPAFISGIENNFPKASITFDKFHVMKLMNEAVDQVRREEQSNNLLLKNTRYIWLKNPENLTYNQKKTLKPLKDLRLKTMKAYSIKLALRDFWSYKYHKSAENYLKKWYFWATHSRLDPVIECAKTIKQHWTGITNYIKSKIDNGILEGTNSIIQAAKDSARGFRSTRNFITTIYLRTGNLKFNLPT